ncbi:DUF5602 domain-containing protein [Flavobacterium laiguense]|uniref:TTHB210-like domain-containing protein n=1 Tax=Flavobacterium laiguense TaxID=2169409 RepID=A0A2U1JX75_9FLAO|nr:DUF5602 domain-containing protein [Flavobacterium laiguense]PWA09559.1 hypothetical protein DB891_07715 [Flavobacterium laiguense]
MENLFRVPQKIIVLGLLFFFFSCSQDEMIDNDSLKTSSESLSNSEITSRKDHIVFKGPEVEIGNGIVRSWFKVGKDEMPLEIGIVMTPGALTGLPDTGGSGATIVLPLHLKATQLTPFKHIGLNWNPHGHPPPGIFDAQHFDIHFYMISNEERLAIPNYSPTTHPLFNNLPSTDYRPLGYISPNGPGEGQMGKHWVPVSIFQPGFFFTKIMIYGSFNGKFIFVEPMVTLDYLLSNPDSRGNPYSQPQYFEKAGYYPTEYNVYYDSKTGNTNITLSKFAPGGPPTQASL